MQSMFPKRTKIQKLQQIRKVGLYFILLLKNLVSQKVQKAVLIVDKVIKLDVKRETYKIINSQTNKQNFEFRMTAPNK